MPVPGLSRIHHARLLDPVKRRILQQLDAHQPAHAPWAFHIARGGLPFEPFSSELACSNWIARARYHQAAIATGLPSVVAPTRLRGKPPGEELLPAHCPPIADRQATETFGE